MKGIVLAGGSGTRLWPITQAVSKQLLPVYNKPMIYYPISTLMAAGIREILVITTVEDAQYFRRLLGSGSQWGIALTYTTQVRPDGLAHAFALGREFLEGQSVALILGDNIFHGQGMGRQLKSCTNPEGGHIFAYEVSDPSRYGVVELDERGHVLSVAEKPARSRSRMAIPGLYFFAGDVVDLATAVTPSARGEFEITSVLESLLAQQRLEVSILSRGVTWMDAGSPDSLLQAAEFVRIAETRQGVGIGFPEETAWRMGWIDGAQLAMLAAQHAESHYARYLHHLSELDSSRV